MASSAASSLGLSQEELKAVELTRQRLFQLSNSIGSLKSDVFNAFPLPHLYVQLLLLASMRLVFT